MTMSERLLQEKRAKKESDVAEYIKGSRRLHDDADNVDVIKIFSGEWYVSNKPGEMIATILGSCVSACIRDPIAGVGGMNHFLLPGEDSSENQISDSARYGVYAMERLINGVIKLGGRKDRFEIKVFGGGNVINNSARIGSKNAQFVRDFLKKEGFKIVSEDLEGDLPRRLHYFPESGKVMLRHLRRKEDMVVLEEEAKYKKAVIATPVESSIELF